MKKSIVLFDMDGTLTEARMAFERFLLPTLSQLVNHAEIGIVSGSDYNYIREQMKLVIEQSEVRYKMHLLPCNGTKHYTPPQNNGSGYDLSYNKDMKEQIGEESFNELISMLLERQFRFSRILPNLSGTFIEYRGSMINWCPIGRSANSKERAAFVNLDTSYSPHLRQRTRTSLLENDEFAKLNLNLKIGGDTRFDIYPKGWDKTYSLKHFPEYDIWFVGDRCQDGGNDKELYDLLQPHGRSYSGKNNSRN